MDNIDEAEVDGDEDAQLEEEEEDKEDDEDEEDPLEMLDEADQEQLLEDTAVVRMTLNKVCSFYIIM
jgi:hypothetical protein